MGGSSLEFTPALTTKFSEIQMPPGPGTHIGVQQPASVLHEVHLMLELLEELLVIT